MERRLIFLLSLVGACLGLRVAVIGEGVIGLSTALHIKELSPDAEITIFHDRPFNESLSKNIAGLFRIDNGDYKEYGNATFSHLAKLWRTVGGLSGVQLISGHILSKKKDDLIKQANNYADIVYNFRYLEDWEMQSQFDLSNDDGTTECIHYTAYTSEGGRYCPFLKEELIKLGVKFHERNVTSLDEIAEDGYSVVVNCAGINGGKLAGDDYGVFPIRGILLKVDAPWQKHFLYRDFGTFTIPMIDSVVVGTVKQENGTDPLLSSEEQAEVWGRYTALQPSFKNVKVIGSYVGFRPGREKIRVESQLRITKSGKAYKAVHNYGHGGNGFTLGWGTGEHAARLALELPTDRYDASLKHKSLPSEEVARRR
ncbi:unnamed protein product [Auanema sp. JU1783]|nr:unnamed protein product [Auanema sp. JU1783]